MTAKMTEEAKVELNPCKAKWFRHYWFIGFEKAESIYLPKIQQLQGEIADLRNEIERLRWFENNYHSEQVGKVTK